jgi:hypothetical protein
VPGAPQVEEPHGVLASGPGTGEDPLHLAFEVGTDLADIERQVMLATLARFGGRRERTAAALAVSLKTLCNRLRDTRRPAGDAGACRWAADTPTGLPPAPIDRGHASAGGPE